MVVDLRFQMLDGERAHPTLAPRVDMPIPSMIDEAHPTLAPRMDMPTPSVIVEEPQPLIIPHPRIPEPVAHTPGFMTMPTPSPTIEEPKPVLPYSVSFPQHQMDELGIHAPSMHARSLSAGSSPVLFVPPTSHFFLYSDTAQAFSTSHSTSGVFRAR
jgi:hypothetical protein